MNRREFLAAAAVAPFAVRTVVAAAAAAAAAPVALVTCDTEARLAVVDLGAFRVVRSIRTVDDPRAVELVGDRAVVCHTAAGAVSIVDAHGVRHVLRDFVEPRYVAAHPDGVHAFVSDSGRSSVSAVDTLRGRVVARASLPGWARHITIDRTGRIVWVSLGNASEHVAVVETSRLRRTALLTPGFLAHDVGHAPDGRLWITSGASRELAVGHATHPADLAPQHVTFAPDRAFVTSGDSGTLHMQTLDGRIVRTTPIPTESYNVQYGFGRVVTPSLLRGTLTVLDARGSLLAQVQVASSCHDACLLPA
ncbi:MAG TPA: hypothetical protein VFA05_02800 [Gaiellaceae bacterium]|nr:hypothetical protein [Gaiellaceae bacterium]